MWQVRHRATPAAAFCFTCGERVSAAPAPRFASPEAYTPKYLVERILTSKSALEGERKQVTVLFADVKGSSEQLIADRDPEEARKLLDPVLEHMMEAVHRFEGTVNQIMGDGIMALFGAPLAHEDHAVRACYAALRMQESMKRYEEEARRAHGVNVQIRVGLNSGEVVVRAIGSDLHMDYTAIGQTTLLAARLEQLAKAGSILLARSTLSLVEGFVAVTPLGPVPVKGLAVPVEVYEMTGTGPARTRLQAAARRGLTRFVARDAEVDQLRRAQQLAGTGHGQVVAVVGEAGVGKSRLVYEFTHSHHLHGWLVLEAASLSYGKGMSYSPVIDLLKSYFKVQDRDGLREIREKVTGKLLTLDRSLESALPALLALLDVPVEDAAWRALDAAQRRQHTLDAVKRLLLREAREQPVLVIFEDLHWTDGETQAVLDTLVDSLSSARVLLLVNHRPEYEHAWGGKTFYRQLRLDALPAEGAAELLDALLGADAELAPLKQLFVKRGNPFFLEETVRTLVETKVLTGERGRYRLTQPVQTIPGPRPPSRPCSRRASIGCLRRRSVCCRWPRSSARTCPTRCSRRSPTCRSRRCAKGSTACKPPSSSTRPGSTPISNTRSSTRSPRTSPTADCSKRDGASCTRGSSGRSSGCTRTVSASTPSGWPITLCVASCPTRR
jgi:class 3 adenylate cyclase